MKPNTTKTLLVAAFAPFLGLACASAPRADAAPASVQAPDVASILEAHDAGWNAHDPEQLAGLFVADGTLVTPTGTRVEGHDALVELFASPGPTKQTTSVTRVESVQFLEDDLVILDAHQTLSGPGVERLGASEARLTAVLRLVDGEWRFVAARPSVIPDR